jgi:hypothetical protein
MCFALISGLRGCLQSLLLESLSRSYSNNTCRLAGIASSLCKDVYDHLVYLDRNRTWDIFISNIKTNSMTHFFRKICIAATRLSAILLYMHFQMVQHS